MNTTPESLALSTDRSAALIDMVDEVAKLACQLHALLIAMSNNPDEIKTNPRMVEDGLWLAMDLADGIFEAAVGFPLSDRSKPMPERLQ